MIKEINCKNANQQATELATEIAKKLSNCIIKKNQAVLAVSGGKSPIAFFEQLSTKDIEWDKVVITLVDERVVETKHSDSNACLVREFLLKNKASKARFISMMSDDYSNSSMSIDDLLKLSNHQFIQPDIVVLGMGEDFHTASLFPFVSDFSSTNPIVTIKPNTAPYQRLSLSLHSILESSSVYLSIGGENKMVVYEKAKELKNEERPISLVLNQSRTTVNVFYFN